MEQEPPPSANLSVTGLPIITTEEIVKELFGSGVIKCRVLPRPQLDDVAALLQFNSVPEAQQIRETYDGSTVQDPRFKNPLKIRYATPGPQAMQATPAALAPLVPQVTPLGILSQGATVPKVLPTTGGFPTVAPITIGKTAGKGSVIPYETTPVVKSTTNLYVKGLPPGVDDEWIRASFAEHGAKVLTCKVLQSDGPSIPWRALVRFASAEEASKVKTSFSGATIEGEGGQSYHITIDYANENPNKPAWIPPEDFAAKKAAIKGALAEAKGAKGKGKVVGKSNKNITISIDEVIKDLEAAGCLPGQDITAEDNCLSLEGLPHDCEEVLLYKLLAPFGPITTHGITIVKDESEKCKGVAYVNFVDPTSLEFAALTLDGKKFPDGTILKAGPRGQ